MNAIEITKPKYKEPIDPRVIDFVYELIKQKKEISTEDIHSHLPGFTLVKTRDVMRKLKKKHEVQQHLSGRKKIYSVIRESGESNAAWANQVEKTLHRVREINSLFDPVDD